MILSTIIMKGKNRFYPGRRKYCQADGEHGCMEQRKI